MHILDTGHPSYRSYLLRVWPTDARGRWRASLHETTTGRICHFASVEALLAFLAAPQPVCEGEEDPHALNQR